jgi:hypothetical protein
MRARLPTSGARWSGLGGRRPRGAGAEAGRSGHQGQGGGLRSAETGRLSLAPRENRRARVYFRAGIGFVADIERLGGDPIGNGEK